jgi:FkbM family methyltransferase
MVASFEAWQECSAQSEIRRIEQRPQARIRTFMSQGFRRYWTSRSIYASCWYWIVSGYSRALIKVSALLPFRGRIARVLLNGDSRPLHLRLGSTDFWVLEEIFAEGEYAMVPGGLASSGAVVIDLGANVGLSVRYWQERWPACRVIAVEPHPENAKLCVLNASDPSGARGCRVIEACVAATRGTGSLTTTDGDWAHKLHPGQSAGSQPVQIITMQDVLEGVPEGEMVGLLKCDIEGAEREVFDTCKAWIRRVRCIVVEIHPPYSLDTLLESIHRAGGKFDVVYQSKKGELGLACLVNRDA